eukprot:NODE_9330_length_601_cov_19.537657_g8696_i0.p1 GENE.NODE_9330_length_601_cov_19.537657_g8696_i0~~NODE_9330_length_601_cov_19.537657_g8696_i0.p1  ORF type:complete len:140 (+),score=6.51 NODE_9330_length_601_cov_19.537657_g8696_i0:60-479(+)
MINNTIPPPVEEFHDPPVIEDDRLYTLVTILYPHTTWATWSDFTEIRSSDEHTRALEVSGIDTTADILIKLIIFQDGPKTLDEIQDALRRTNPALRDRNIRGDIARLAKRSPLFKYSRLTKTVSFKQSVVQRIHPQDFL